MSADCRMGVSTLGRGSLGQAYSSEQGFRRPRPENRNMIVKPDHVPVQWRPLSAAAVCAMVLALLGLDPFTILAALTRTLRLVAVRQHVVFAKQVFLQVGHGAAAVALGFDRAARVGLAADGPGE